MQSVTLSKKLIAKAIELNSYSIVSPTGRLSTSAKNLGAPLNTTVYFTGLAVVDAKGKVTGHGKGAVLYVSDKADAAVLKATCIGVDTIKISDTVTYRWLKSDMTPADTKAVNTLKGVLKINRIMSGGIGSLQQVLKGAAGMYIKGLPREYKEAFTNKMAQMVMATCDDINRVQADKEEEVAFFNID